MVTGTMNTSDIQKIYIRDKERIFRFLNYREKDLRRDLRKGFFRKCARCYDYKTENAQYKLALCVYNKRSIFDVYMYIHETNEYVIVTAKANNFDYICMAYTPHYIKRIGERVYGLKEIDVNKVLTYFILDSNTTINIHQKDDKYVLANNNGISLAIYDEKRELMIMKTFVSIEMLKSSQIAAWSRVADTIKKLDVFVERSFVRNEQPAKDVLFDVGCEIDKLNMDEINAIYDVYFKDKKL